MGQQFTPVTLIHAKGTFHFDLEALVCEMALRIVFRNYLIAVAALQRTLLFVLLNLRESG